MHPTTRLLPAAALALVALVACADDGGPGDVAAWCYTYEVVSEVDPAATDPAELEANLEQFQAALADAVDAAPDEIADANRTLAAAFDDYVAEAEAADYHIAEVDVDGFFGAEDVASAGGEVDAFAEEHCDS